MKRGGIISWGLLVVAFLIAGCAGPRAAYNRKSPSKTQADLARYREVIVDVRVKEVVKLPQQVRDGVVRRISDYIKADFAGKFPTVTPDQAGPATLGARVFITRYDDGVALAQSTFSVQGRMHIDGGAILFDWQTKEMLAEFEVSRTCDWDNFHGAATRIDELEPEFARGVVAGIAQQE